jgi:hypothetical protein
MCAVRSVQDVLLQQLGRGIVFERDLRLKGHVQNGGMGLRGWDG